MRLAAFPISITRLISTKLLAVSETSIKIKVRSHGGTLCNFAYLSTGVCKQRLFNGNETVNAIILVKAILESPYKVLQSS